MISINRGGGANFVHVLKHDGLSVLPMTDLGLGLMLESNLFWRVPKLIQNLLDHSPYSNCLQTYVINSVIKGLFYLLLPMVATVTVRGNDLTNLIQALSSLKTQFLILQALPRPSNVVLFWVWYGFLVRILIRSTKNKR